VLRGQLELNHKSLAKGQLRKICCIVSRGPRQKGQQSNSGSVIEANLKMLVLTGRIFQVIFQKRCFNLSWTFKFQRHFQSGGERGEGLKRELEEATSWADFTENWPDEEGDQIQRSGVGERGMWIERMALADGGSKRKWIRGEFQPLTG
jgi:hypothetical protein